MDGPTLLGETYGFWIQTGAIILSILVTGYYARKALIKNGMLARETLEHNHKMQSKRATIDLILQENQDVALNNAKQIVAKLPDDSSFIKYLDASDEESQRIKESIRILLNRYEFIALGVKNGAFEESIYKELQYTDVMNVWKKAKPLIMELRLRRNVNTYFQEFEELAENWALHPIKAHKES